MIKIKFFFSFCVIYLLFVESETSLNYSTFDQLDFVGTHDFDSNVVIGRHMTS